MNVLLILILASLGVALLFLGAFIWSVRSGQYEDTLTPSMRVLMDDDRSNMNRNSDATLPLTLTLTLGEREQQTTLAKLLDDSNANTVATHSLNRRTILPFPKGEGRGEGERTVKTPTISANHSNCAISKTK